MTLFLADFRPPPLPMWHLIKLFISQLPWYDVTFLILQKQSFSMGFVVKLHWHVTWHFGLSIPPPWVDFIKLFLPSKKMPAHSSCRKNCRFNFSPTIKTPNFKLKLAHFLPLNHPVWASKLMKSIIGVNFINIKQNIFAVLCVYLLTSY